jgi:hypothetical protein
LFRNRQNPAGGTSWGLQATPLGNNEAKQMSVCLDSLGRLEIVYVGTNGHIYHNRQNSAGSNDWVGETAFAGLQAKQVQVVSNPNNQHLLEIYYIGSGNGLHRIRQNSLAMTDWSDHGFDNDYATQLSVGTNADGRLEIFYVGTNGDLYHNWLTSTVDMTKWFGETRFPGSSANYVTALSNADGRLEIFYTGRDNALYHNWQASPNGNWVGEVRSASNWALQIVGGQNINGHLEICYIGTNGVLYHNFQLRSNANWTNSNASGGQATPPPRLNNNSNYFLSNCGFLTDVAVTIIVSEDIYCDKAAPHHTTNFDPSQHGYSFQLNCCTPAGAATVFQQYNILVSSTGKELQGLVNVFTAAGPILSTPSIALCSVSSKITAGYQLQTNLLNDESGNIIGVNFRVVDNRGNLAGDGSIMLAESGIKVAPIVTCTMNIVGEINGLSAHFATGAGEIIYAASSPMTAESAWPNCVGSEQFTIELSNSTYGPVSPLPSNVLTQTFGVS